MAKKRVIAVFGPTQHKDGPPVAQDILKSARAAGIGIAKSHILLTGGKGRGEQSVKDVAIAGADQRGPWVGVLASTRTPKADDRGTSIVIRSGLGRRRNLLEALMCDAAIAFAGGNGTRSEVACAFALERPVALVGAEWKRFHDLEGSNGHHVAYCLLNSAGLYFASAEEAGDDLGDQLQLEQRLSPARGPDLLEAARRLPMEQRPYRYFDLRERDTIQDVIEWVSEVPAPEGAPGREFPVKAIATEYESWLARAEQAT